MVETKEIWKDVVLGCTNRFFGENIVQTTNRNGNENCSGKDELI